MKKESLYLDSSVPSAYYDARVEWRMNFTRQWWQTELPKYEQYISGLVIAEIMRTENVIRRQELSELVADFSRLDIVEELNDIAQGYIERHILPPKSFDDALHIAVASFYKIDFLVTWNCAHIAEAHKRKQIRLFNTSAGLFVPEIVTPMELLRGGEEDV